MNDGTERRLTVLTLTLLTGFAGFLGSLGVPMVPGVAAHYHVPIGWAQWTATAPIVAGAAVTPILGRLGDGRRGKRVLLVALLLVLIGSILASVSVPLGWLIVGRTLQGVGAGVGPVAIAAASRILSPDRFQGAVGRLGVAAVVGSGVAFPLSGWVSDHGGFRAAFGLGAVLSLVCLILVQWAVPDFSADIRAARPDWVGAVVVTVAVVAALLAIARGGEWGWTSLPTIGLAVASLALCAYYAVHERIVRAPFVRAATYLRGRLLALNVVTITVGMGNYGICTLGILTMRAAVQDGYGLGFTAVEAGLGIVPYAICSGLGARAIKWSGSAVGARRVLLGSSGLVCIGLGLASMSSSTLPAVVVPLAVAGLGVGAHLAVVPLLLSRLVDPVELGTAVAFNQLLRYIGFAAGGAAVVAVLEGFHLVSGGAVSSDGHRLAAVLLLATVLVGLVWCAQALRAADGRTHAEPASSLGVDVP